MKTQELIKKLEAGVEEVFKSGRFQEWLKIQSTFHNYSYANTMLILAQKPNATRVAGFHAWKKLGRYVMKGEKGISILAPVIAKKELKDEKTEEVIGKKEILAGFKPVHVFDISQTDGKPLPQLADELESNSLVAEEIIKKLYNISKENGIKVITFQEGERDEKGYFSPGKNEIGIKEAASDQQAKTFLHEITHAFTHHKAENYQEGEIIAEGTAFVVASFFGLDTGNYSFEYVAAWASRAEKDALKKVAHLIQSTANKLIQQLQPKEKALAI